MQSLSVRCFSNAGKIWFRRLAKKSWEAQFSPKILKQGQKFYKESYLKSLEIRENELQANLVHEQNEIYLIIQWEPFQIRASFKENILKSVFAVVAFYSLEEWLTIEPNLQEVSEDHLTEEQPKPSSLLESKGLLIEKKEESLPLVLKKNASEPLVEKSCFSLQFFMLLGRLAFKLSWNKNASLKVALAHPQMREKWLMLLHLIRKDGFKEKSKKLWTFSKLEDMAEFYQNRLPVWQKHFKLTMTPEIELLKRGRQKKALEFILEEESNALTIKGFLGKTLLDKPKKLKKVLENRFIWSSTEGLIELDSLTQEQESAITSFISKGQIPKYCLFALTEQYRLKVSLQPELQAWKEQFLSSCKSFSLSRVLRSYQKQGVYWLEHVCNHLGGALLADEMGLGKTLQVLSFLNKHLAKEKAKVLLVCPSSVISVWQKEIRRFYPKISWKAIEKGFDGPSADTQLYLISYSQLRRKKEQLTALKWTYVILDEAQAIKNVSSKITQVCFSLKADYRIAMTGTPFENHLGELWSIFRFLYPGLLGSYSFFQHYIAQEENRNHLNDLLSLFLLRRTKNQVAKELPKKVCSILSCPMNELQKLRYGQIAGQALNTFGDNTLKALKQSRVRFLSSLVRLRQVCCDPSLLPDLSHEFLSSSKFQMLLKHLSRCIALGYKVVIFSQFVKFLDKLEIELQKRFEIPLFKLIGQTKNRGDLIYRFEQHADSAIFLCSLKAGGVGISLISAEVVFLCDPWWNPAVEEQAIDRVHRIGQRKTVFVYRLLTPDSIESKVYELQFKKKTLFERFLGRNLRNLLKHLPSLRELFAFPLPGKFLSKSVEEKNKNRKGRIP